MNPEMYLVRSGHEWAYIVLEEATGLFMAHGSWGTFAHTWPTAYRHTPLKKFLAKLDIDYFMKKARGAAYKVFDLDMTVDRMRTAVCEYRRTGAVTKEQARDAWNEIGDAADNHSMDERGFMDALYYDRDVTAVLGHDDFWEWACQKIAPECRGFWETIWPTFLDQIADTAQGMEARSDETPQAAQPSGDSPTPTGDAPK